MTSSAKAHAGHNSMRLGPINYRDPAELTPYPGNPRKHPQKQIVKLKASIEEFGFVAPVMITPKNEIIAGEACVEAARSLGLAQIPTITIEHLSPTKVRALRLAFNRLAELSDWNTELLAIEIEEILLEPDIHIEAMGWETGEIDALLSISDADPASKIDPADEIIDPPTMPISRTGDVWVLGQHRLLCGSSLESASWDVLMSGKVARMAFTDAPYNVPISGHVSGLGKVKHAEFAMASGEMTKAEFTAFIKTFLEQMTAHLSDGAITFSCIDWRHIFEMLDAGNQVGLQLLNLCVWNKRSGGMGSLFRSKYELVLVFKKGKAPHTNNVELGKHGRYRTNVWDYAGVNTFGAGRMDDLKDHPTVKPIALVADAIRDVSHHGDIVLDAFMGSGTTILAAERAGRIAYGIEIEPGYVDVAIRRWEKMTGKQAVLESTGQTFAQVAAERTTPVAEAA